MITKIICRPRIPSEALKNTPLYVPGNNSRKHNSRISKKSLKNKYDY
jgi:hypothetical protein